MKNIINISLILFFFSTFALAQNNALKDLQRGAQILARQYYQQKEIHKAKTLVKFLTIVDKNNPNNENLIEAIKTKKSLRVYQTLDDNGIKYESAFTIRIS